MDKKNYQKGLVSIIVPAYNVENELSESLDSLLHQTYNDIEVVVVNDGSNDNTGNIADEYAAADCRVRVIHQDNQGVSAARNLALEKCNGEWVFFVDADDTLVSTGIEEAVRLAKESNAPIVDFNYCRVINGREIASKVSRRNLEETFKSCIQQSLIYSRTFIIPRLFRHEYIENVRFRKRLKIGEDILFCIQVMINHPNLNIVHSSKTIYRYILREGSAMQNGRTFGEYDILNTTFKSVLAGYSDYKAFLSMFCCINYYFKAIKQKQVLNHETYNKLLSEYSLSDCFIKGLHIKFRILFLAYKLNRLLGNGLLKFRYTYFEIK